MHGKAYPSVQNETVYGLHVRLHGLHQPGTDTVKDSSGE